MSEDEEEIYIISNRWETILEECNIPYKFEIETPCNKCRQTMKLLRMGLIDERTALVSGWQREPFDFEAGRLTAFIEAFHKFQPNCNLKAHVLSYESGCTVTKVVRLYCKEK